MLISVYYDVYICFSYFTGDKGIKQFLCSILVYSVVMYNSGVCLHVVFTSNNLSIQMPVLNPFSNNSMNFMIAYYCLVLLLIIFCYFTIKGFCSWSPINYSVVL